MPFGGGQGKWQVSANGGTAPQWSKDGKELYYFCVTDVQSFCGPGKGMRAARCNSAPLRSW